jgi:hypothetical protein
MNLSFKRITSSGSFIPEIDGLRFIAIASVVVMHASVYIMIKDQSKYIDAFNFELLAEILALFWVYLLLNIISPTENQFILNLTLLGG